MSRRQIKEEERRSRLQENIKIDNCDITFVSLHIVRPEKIRFLKLLNAPNET